MGRELTLNPAYGTRHLQLYGIRYLFSTFEKNKASLYSDALAIKHNSPSVYYWKL